jgi:hypothetical protein
MPPAVIAAGVVAAGTIGGAVLGSHAQSKANKQAAQTQDNATNAQLQLGHESLDLNKQIYNSNYDTLSPWVSRGNVAGDAYSALLGLPTAPVMHSPLASPAPAATPAPAAGGQGLIKPASREQPARVRPRPRWRRDAERGSRPHVNGNPDQPSNACHSAHELGSRSRDSRRNSGPIWRYGRIQELRQLGGNAVPARIRART